jgi:hypothetical protein
LKYTYAYKTSDGIRHEDSMNASSREEVFEALRARGIKAIKVVAADGSKANGEVRGVRKRVVVALVALVAVGAGVVAYIGGERTASANGGGAVDRALTSGTRRQVSGDVAIIEKGIRTGWSEVFEREGDRFLASFAIPGVPAGQRSTSAEEMRRALEGKVAPQPTDPIEVQQIKAMVEGMKEEARRYIAAGGSPVGYGRRLVERQEAEIAIYNRVKNEIETIRKTMAEDAFESYLEERNDELRNLGIKPIVDNRD